MTSPAIDLTAWYAKTGAQPFSERRATMPWRSAVPVPAESVQERWQQLLATPAPPRKRLVYLHIPFCATHCTFCGFYQNSYRAEACARYTDYLLRELELEAHSALHQSAPIHAIYFGGGTPSALAASDLYRIISQLRQTLPLAPDCEITLEGRVMHFDEERICASLDAGANRFSVGIQTFNSAIRQRMGRTSDGEQARRFMESLVRHDRASVVCDLMFGLPGQDAQSWQQDLAIVKEIGLDGVDLYALNLLPSTPLGKAVANQRVTLPDHLERRDLYLMGCEVLADAGWNHISNSHWARTTRERNLYNLLIKQGADCLALGSGAGGSLNGYAWMVERNLERYYQAIDQQQKPLMMLMESPGNDSRWHHQLQAGIEVGRVPLNQLTDHAATLQPLLDQWHHAGLTRDTSHCLRLTREGRYWASNLLQALQQLIPLLNTK
ncbi:heme anaerobic degradation radical SAM methyltransferase [Paramixta manurensis]|uniref:Heme anaerobic degradation radical SAM methyltransferase n=1 Tax=Paramixta manurensis TaxID=2740817 RepID=A0A6M8UFL9_9GAMM|nr:heme anaerobic degradation radical SAM methyltransferase [Erwiniaceae bacterium PD-1]